MPLSRGHQRHHRPDPVAAGTSSTEMPVLVVLTSMATMLEKPFGRYQFVKRIANALRGACTPRCRDELAKTPHPLPGGSGLLYPDVGAGQSTDGVNALAQRLPVPLTQSI
ncbi:hypothetical protein PC120_g13467 [Phytophthora cactorum]|nr:hypothetical protein PC120_g13467 [Phytophthora cactorum]